jgi:hypothetical protein
MNSSQLASSQPWIFPVLFLAFMFIGIPFISSLFDGWSILAREFQCSAKPTGETRKSGYWTGAMYLRNGWSDYRKSLILVAAEDGLYLSMRFSFALFHPPLRIPWNEIEASMTSGIFNDYVELLLGRQTRIPLRIRPSVAGDLGLAGRFPRLTIPCEPSSEDLDALSDEAADRIDRQIIHHGKDSNV